MLDWVDSNMDKLDGRELYPLWIKDQVFVRKCSSAEERAMMVSGLPALWVCMSASEPHAILFYVTTDSGAVSQEARFLDCDQAITNAWSLFCTFKNSLPEVEEKTLALHAHACGVKDRAKAAKRKKKKATSSGRNLP